MSSRFQRLGRLGLAFVVSSAIAACGESADDRRVTIITDETGLEGGVTTRDEPVEVEPAGLPNGRAVPVPTDYELTLVAEVAPPEIDGVTLQATSVMFADSVAVVSYNVAGNQQVGAVDVFVFDADKKPTLASRATFSDTDVNAVGTGKGRVLLATATANESLGTPAVVEGIGVGPDGTLVLDDSHFRLGLPSYAVTSVAFGDGRIYATSGDKGGVYALDADGTTVLASQPLDDARWLTVPGDGTVVAVRGTPGEVVVYDAATLVERSRFPFDGATIPESKSTLEVLGGKAFVAGGPAGALVLDLASGKELARIPVPIVGAPDPDSVTNAVSVEGDLVFVSNGAGGVYLVAASKDLSAAEEPGSEPPTFTTIGRLAFAGDGGGSVNHITYKDGFLFVATGRGGLKIVRVDGPSCDNGILDGDERDVDCGGACGACADGLSCSEHADCLSARCLGGTCVERCPSAADAVTVCAFASDLGPLAGVVVEYSQNGAPWTAIGTTDADGRVRTSVVGDYLLRYTYRDALVTRPVGTYLAGSTVELQTVRTVVTLSDHDDQPIADGMGQLSFYGNRGNWQFQTQGGLPWSFDEAGQVVLELFPAAGYTFRTTYRGASQQKATSIQASHRDVAFRTVEAVIRATDSSGAPLPGTFVSYYGNQGVWQYDPTQASGGHFRTDADGEVRIELLPVNDYVVRLTTAGASQSQKLDASKDPNVAFATVGVTVSVRTSQGKPIVGSPIRYYGNQGVWQYATPTGVPFQSDDAGDVHLELLPVAGFHVAASFAGASWTQGVDASAESDVVFQTIAATIRGLTSKGAPRAGVHVRYYGNEGVWQYKPLLPDAEPFSTNDEGTTHLELFPVPGYTIEASLAGASQRFGFDADKSAELEVQTALTSFLVKGPSGPIAGAELSYYGNQGAWQVPLVTDKDGRASIELLPVVGYVARVAVQNVAMIATFDVPCPDDVVIAF